jgi:hypothetical protein
MDLLQIALVFLIVLLAVFLSVTGFYVFLILRDLKKALDRLNKVLQTGEDIVHEVEKPVAAAANLVTSLSDGAKALGIGKKDSKPKPKRFYRKIL